ncbi:MAG: tyrosine-protein phosphatase [Spirochaetales bacterium]|nr:tyrosine-protein phosphatase [Spirochaetales bacterium]
MSSSGKNNCRWSVFYQYKLKNTAEFITENIDIIHQIINLLLDPNIYPVVIHCGQGKDRTGVVIASLLWLLDVDESDITRDYLLSNNVPNLFECVKPEYINQLYHFLHKNQKLGILENTLVHLKRLLLRKKCNSI